MKSDKIKKIISINLIIISILSIFNLGQKSFASNENSIKQGNINISNIEKGVTISLYQIATQEIDEEQNQPTENYKWNDKVQNWINQNAPEYSETKKFYDQVKNDSNKISEFYDKITTAFKENQIEEKAYREQKVEGEPTFPVTEENLNGNLKFSDVEVGTYIVLIENGYVVYTPSVINLIPNFDTDTNKWILEDKNVVIKASKPSIRKLVTQEGMVKDNYSTADRIFYVIKSDIPKFLENSISKKYTICDEMDKSLVLDKSTIMINAKKKEGGDTAEWLTKYNVSIDESTDKRIVTINFDYNELKEFETLEIMYRATLAKNEELNIGKNGNNNKAFLDYSNNPYEKSSIQTISTENITVYTYEMDIKSVDKDDTNIGLAGSEFEIINSDGQKLYFVKGQDGTYYLAEQDEENAVTNVKVDNLGNLYIKGIDEGDYTIKQVRAPDGYNISSKSYKMNIKDSNLDGELDEEYTLIFPNSKGFVLPVTGGTGAIILYILGAILILTGMLMIISINKKRKILNNK